MARAGGCRVCWGDFCASDSSCVCGYVRSIWNSGEILSRFGFGRGNGFDGRVVSQPSIVCASIVIASRERLGLRAFMFSDFAIRKRRIWRSAWELHFN